MNIKKVLFIDSTHKVLRDELIELGFQTDYFPDYSKKEYENIIEDYFGIIVRSKIKIDKNFIDKGKKLKFIARVGAGLENIDVKYAESKGIKCFNSPEGNRDSVGEHALGMLLSLLNNLNRADKEVRQGIWRRRENWGVEIKGKTVGIIGYGNMGGAFAQRLQGFQANVIAYDKYKFNYSDKYVCEKSLQEVFEQTDILSIHVPLTDETLYMINDEFINKFKKNIYIINTARGKVLKTDDLVKNIKSGKVLGAALDVLEYEKLSFENINKQDLPYSFQYLANSEKVVLSPHIAGWTYESNYKLSKFIVDKIKAYFKL
ncbi:MAG: hypothetical protein J7J86_09235 [Bacteroidales bacterium]|nr:hypothetical protein [Bacteroidales bacterium]